MWDSKPCDLYFEELRVRETNFPSISYCHLPTNSSYLIQRDNYVKGKRSQFYYIFLWINGFTIVKRDTAAHEQSLEKKDTGKGETAGAEVELGLNFIFLSFIVVFNIIRIFKLLKE